MTRSVENNSTKISERLAKLSPAKRALLERKLRQQREQRPPSTVESDEGQSSPVLSFAQERMWFLHQLTPDSPVYHIPSATHLEGPLSVSALRNALDDLVNRHQALRTRIATNRGQPTPVVGPGGCALEILDLSGKGLQPDDESVREAMESRVRRPFDLSQDTMIRATLVRLAPGQHILLIALHHIASDAWSMRIMHHELAELYSSRVEKRSPGLPELSAEYTDYARRQRDQLQGTQLDSLLGYWKEQLAGSPPVLQLPTDYPRRPRQRYQGARETSVLPPRLAAGIGRLSLSYGGTNFMTLLAAFQLLLHRYSGQDDICVGTPVANRNQHDFESIVGFFVNTLVLRIRLAGDPTAREVLAQVREKSVDALDHQDLPFERLVAEMNTERDLSRSPLFQAMLVYHSRSENEPNYAGLTSRRLPISTGTAKFDLNLVIADAPSSLQATFEYDTDLFAPATIRRMSGHFQVLLESLVANPDQWISELALLPGNERQQILYDWNDTQKPVSAACLHELFEAQVKRTPASTALVWQDGETSYEELDRRADCLAGRLQELGVGPDVPVVLCLERTPALVVAALAILKAGGAYLPLDPAYPRARLEYILEDCGAPVIITQSDVRDRLPTTNAELVLVESDGRLPRPAAERQLPPVGHRNLAYLIYTSGSTGKPKGTCIEHRNVVALIDWALETFSRDELAGTLASTSLSFDISVFELFAPLSCGGKIILAENVLELPELPRRGDVTLINTVPSAIATLISHHRLPESVQTVTLVGEKVEAPLVDEVFKLGSVNRVCDIYGPTECTVFATMAHRTPAGPVTIGRPISNTTAYILDRSGQPVPVGVSGELCLGGALVARGYWRRPALTAERFIPDPYGRQPNARLYKTGDLARFLPDGNIDFLGRLDYQVKLRGFRIELGEIESVLAGHPGVRQAAVVLRDAGARQARLVAFCENSEPGEPASGDLREFVCGQLPEHMRPAQYVFLDRLPRTPNGKVNRNELPNAEAPSASNVLVSPRTPVEAELLRLWEKTLGSGAVGVTDSFFEVGGHSLLAVRLFAEIEDTFGKRLSTATLFEAPTIEELAAVVEDSQWRPRWESLVPIQPVGSNPPLFCIHGAKGDVLFYSELAAALGPDQPVYGLQSRGLASHNLPAPTIQDSAAQYIDEMRSVQPSGPYQIGGFCLGAYVALEMAIQLRQMGEEVALLVSFNTDGAWKMVGSVMDGLQYHWRNLNHVPPGQQGGYLVARARYRIGRMARALEGARTAFLSRSGHPLPDELFRHQIEEIHRSATERYKPVRYEGKVVLMQGIHDEFRDGSLFWSRLVGAELERHLVPGRGVSILQQPNVATLAEKLQPYLAGSRRKLNTRR